MRSASLNRECVVGANRSENSFFTLKHVKSFLNPHHVQEQPGQLQATATKEDPAGGIHKALPECERRFVNNQCAGVETTSLKRVPVDGDRLVLEPTLSNDQRSR
jgi:hypothetical protein